MSFSSAEKVGLDVFFFWSRWFYHGWGLNSWWRFNWFRWFILCGDLIQMVTLYGGTLEISLLEEKQQLSVQVLFTNSQTELCLLFTFRVLHHYSVITSIWCFYLGNLKGRFIFSWGNMVTMWWHNYLCLSHPCYSGCRLTINITCEFNRFSPQILWVTVV